MRFEFRSIWTRLLVVSLFLMLGQLLWTAFPNSAKAAAFAFSGTQEGVANTEDANPAANNSGTDNKSKDISVLGWLIEALGWMYILVFLALSFVMVGLVIINILAARRDYVCPPTLVAGFESLLDEKKYQDAYELAKTDGSFLGNVLSSGLARLSSGYDHAVEAMQEVGTEENMKIQHRLSYLSLVGNISPMVGLLGTVDGMVRSFFVIATAGGTPPADKLADGIAKALVTTLVGLLIAIPAIAAFTILRNRFEQLELEVGINSGNLMSRFEKVGGKKTEMPSA